MEVGLAKYCPIIISSSPFSPPFGMMLLPPPPLSILLLLFEVDKSSMSSNAAKLSPPSPLLFDELESEEEVDIIINL